MSEHLPGGGIELSPAEIDALGARWSSCFTPATEDYLLYVFREPHDGDTWICRRDQTICLP